MCVAQYLGILAQIDLISNAYVFTNLFWIFYLKNFIKEVLREGFIMVFVFLLLIVCTILAYAYKAGLVEVPATTENTILEKKNKATFTANFLFAVLAIILIVFAGTRKEMNDTLVYAGNFRDLDYPSIFSINDWSMGSNPLFMIYQIIIKKYITTNPYAFFLITSTITVLSYMLFLRKYSVNFGFSLYLFIAFTVYAFTMTAMKQTMSVAIAVWAFPALLKGKKLRFFILIAIAMFVHPYVLLYAVMIFLTDEIWDKRSLIIVILTLIFGFFFTHFIGGATEFTTWIGDEYTEELLEGTVNIFRVLVYLVTPFLSFIYRDTLRKQNSKYINLLVNLSLVSASLMIIGSFGGANLMGRLANYFDIFICISLPVIIDVGMGNEQNRKTVTLVAFACFVVFYYTYYSKYADVSTNPYFGDFYNHTTLFDIFANWR